MLEELDVPRRVRLLQERLSAQLEIVRLQQKLHKDVSSQFTDMQRRAYLREQVKAIQRELGENEQAWRSRSSSSGRKSKRPRRRPR